MKRRIQIAVAAVAVLAAVIWAVSAWVAHRSRYEYSGTVETRDLVEEDVSFELPRSLKRLTVVAS